MHQVHQALEAHIEPGVAHAIRVVAAVARSQEARTWLVGGIIRDAVLGVKSPHQIPDIVVAGDVHNIADSCVKRCNESSVLTRSMFQTCRVQISGHTIELAAARRDTYEPHGSLPTIRLVPHIRADLPRRDFTVNAMAVELTPEGYGRFYDPFNGLADTASSTLRVLHQEAFSEDPTRMLRGVRLSTRYDLRIERETADDLNRALSALSTFLASSPNRLFAEFARWFEPHENLRGIVDLAQEFGLTRALLMEPISKSKVNMLGQEPDLYDADSRFATFLQLLDKRASRNVSQNLPLTRRWQDLLDDTIKIRTVFESTDWDSQSDSEVANKLRQFDYRVVRATTMFVGRQHLAARLQRIHEVARRTKPHLSGRDVEELGIQTGPEIGAILRELTNLRIDDRIATREDEVEYVRRRHGSNATERLKS